MLLHASRSGRLGLLREKFGLEQCEKLFEGSVNRHGVVVVAFNVCRFRHDVT